MAASAQSYKAFQSGDTVSSAVVGYDWSSSATGKFYVQTSGQPPYSLGQAGSTYNATIKCSDVWCFVFAQIVQSG